MVSISGSGLGRETEPDVQSDHFNVNLNLALNPFNFESKICLPERKRKLMRLGLPG
jgi:hypothetical protein